MKKKLPLRSALLIALPLILLGIAAGILHIVGLRSRIPLITDGLEIRFLDVGQGDAALVLCGGKAMLIDGGPAQASRRLYSEITGLGLKELDAVICTHPDQDHAGGLAGALQAAPARTAWCSTDTDSGSGFQNFCKYLDRENVPLQIPAAGDSFSLGAARCTFLGPVRPAQDDNNNSLVLQVRYGETVFLFTGDAEYAEEQDILSAVSSLECQVLKVAHHGSRTSTSPVWLEAVRPRYAVISVGAGNDYGHPSRQVLDLLASRGTTVFRTDLQGDILCRSDGKTVSFSCEKNPPVPAQAAPPQEETAAYVLNQRSRKFHLPGCSGAASISEKNRLETNTSRESLISQGYTPCGTCKP